MERDTIGRAYLPCLLCFPKHPLPDPLIGRKVTFQPHLIGPSLWVFSFFLSPTKTGRYGRRFPPPLLSLPEEGMPVGHFGAEPLP